MIIGNIVVWHYFQLVPYPVEKILHKVGLDPGLHNGQMKKWMPEKIALVYGIFLISDLNE